MRLLVPATLLAVLPGSVAQAQTAQPSPIPLNPAQPKVAAPSPAPSVMAGEGGGPGRGPPTPAALQAGQDATRRALEVGRRAATLGYPQPGRSEFIMTGVNHIGGRLNLPDGKTISLERVGPPMLLQVGDGGSRLVGDEAMARRILREGDNLKVYISVLLTTGEFIDPPPFTIPIGGGTQTVPLPGGGTATLVIDGAHPLTAQEQQYVDSVNAIRPAAPAPK